MPFAFPSESVFAFAGIRKVRWFVEGKTYSDALWNSSGQESWTVTIQLTGGDYIDFTRVANMHDSSLNVGALTTIVRRTLSRPLEQAQAVSAGAGSAPDRKPPQPAISSQNLQVAPDLPRKVV